MFDRPKCLFYQNVHQVTRILTMFRRRSSSKKLSEDGSLVSSLQLCQVGLWCLVGLVSGVWWVSGPETLWCQVDLW